MKTRSLCVYICLIFLSMACKKHPETPSRISAANDSKPEESLSAEKAAEIQKELEQAALSLLQNKCASCHNEELAEGGYRVADVDTMVADGFLVAGKPDQSRVFIRTEITADMPTAQPLADSENLTLWRWIRGLEAKPDPIAILEQKCQGCHNPKNPLGDFATVTDVASMINSGRYIVIGNPEQSQIYSRLAPDGDMPPNGDFSEDERLVIKDWIIELGAYLKDRKPLSTKQELQLIADDLNKLPPEAQRRARYFSLRSLYNGMVADEVLNTIRKSLDKSLNSLSRSPEVVKATPLDAGKVVYRIDLESIAMSTNRFNTIMNDFYPFRKTYTNNGTPEGAELAALDNEIRTKSSTNVYLMNMDWFSSTALLPPLYEQMLNLPNTTQQLEQRLNVSLRQNIFNSQVMRSGFKDSGVSFNNRIIERHVTDDGLFFWISYDFAESQDQQNIFDNPLGPVGSGFDNNAFIEDGGEVIFQLPNGFFGYYLLNGVGTAIDKGPLNVVKQSDAPSPLLTTIVNGFSCGTCHGQGLLFKTDEIRGFAAKSQNFGNQAKNKIMDLYPDPKVLKATMDKDNLIFTNAMKKAGLDPTAPDPIKTTFEFYNRKLSLQDVAMELNITAEAVTKLMERNPFRDDWAGLSVGGNITREEFNLNVRRAMREDNKVQTFNPIRGDVIATPECMVADAASFNPCIEVAN